MTTIQAIILGAVQGVTEFLPISSSGHLVLFQHLFGAREAALFFNVSVHVGTLAAVVLFFRKEIVDILKHLPALLTDLMRGRLKAVYTSIPQARIALLILIGSIPTAIMGLAFREVADRIFSSILIVGINLLITGAVLWGTKRLHRAEKSDMAFTALHALIIGVAQGAAILPGISRSGATIAAGLYLGINRITAARYSFLLSLPAILGAELLSLMDVTLSGAEITTAVIGTVVAFVVGYASLALLMLMVNRGKLHLFAPYCWLIGAVTLVAWRL